jgi:hypothetical protein
MKTQTLVIVPGLTYECEFVPQSASRNAGRKEPSLNWKVTFKTSRGSLTTDYTQGIGHLKGYRHGRKSVDDAADERRAAESGRWSGYDRYGSMFMGRTLPEPAPDDVMQSLLMEAEAIDHPTYEEWAGNFGYDPDSREGERVYRACLDIGLKLRAMLGEETIRMLKEALADI